MNIKKFVESVLADKENKKRKHSFGKLSAKEMKKIKAATDIDTTNYKRVIDSFGVKHTLKKHGNDKKENSRGQISVKNGDFQKIPQITSQADKIEAKGVAKRGGELIEYTKTMDEKYIYVEEKRDKQKELALKTMYKKKKNT